MQVGPGQAGAPLGERLQCLSLGGETGWMLLPFNEMENLGEGALFWNVKPSDGLSLSSLTVQQKGVNS